MHPLQEQFHTAAGEAAWEDRMRACFVQGELDALHSELSDALVALDSEFGRMCLAITPDQVVIAGWDELVEAIETHEGDPVTGLTLAVANESDRVFEKGQLHHPYMMLGLYTDEPYAFTAANAEMLLEQMQVEDGPAWAGYDEDVEVYLDLEGLDHLNTALLHHKQRHFFRDDAKATVPLRYVEYVVGCWWRALLFHQAVSSECAIHGLPGGIPVVCGMVEMRPEIVMVHGLGARTIEREPAPEAKPAAPILAADFIQVRTVEEIEELSGSNLRRRVIETGQEDEAPAPKRSFFARIFGR